jgi:hypothetical protein
MSPKGEPDTETDWPTDGWSLNDLDFERCTHILLFVVKSCTPLNLVSTTEELLERKSSGSGLENKEYDSKDPSHWPRDSLYPQKLALTAVYFARGLRPQSCSYLVTSTMHSFPICCFVINRSSWFRMGTQDDSNSLTIWSQYLAGFIVDSRALRAERKICFSCQRCNTFRLSAHNHEVRIFHLKSSTLCYSLLYISQMSPPRWEQSTEFRNANKTINAMTQTIHSLDSLRDNCVSLSLILLIS